MEYVRLHSHPEARNYHRYFGTRIRLGSRFVTIWIASLDIMASQGGYVESLWDAQLAAKRPITVKTF